MAKGNPNSRSAHGTPSSLTSLLSTSSPLAIPSPTITPEQVLADPVINKQLHHGRYHADPIGDRRRYHPQGYHRPAHSLIKAATRLAIGKEPYSLHFRVPNLVTICLRRKTRREILFALDRTHRKGRGGGKKRKRNFYSRISC